MSIDLIVGPMFCGKTTELISRARIEALSHHNVLIIKYEKDDRYDDGEILVTHDGHSQGSRKNITIVKRSELLDSDIDNFDVICIDEGQFYKNIHITVERWANEYNRHVIISALNGDSNSQLFGDIYKLFPLAETITKKLGICMECKSNPKPSASSVKKIESGTHEQVDIGGSDKYIAVCRGCRNIFLNMSTSL